MRFRHQYACMYEAPIPPDPSVVENFLTHVTLPLLPPDFAQALDEDISSEEVSRAMKSLKVGKRQGPDGFSAKFYQLLSPVLVPGLITLYNEIKESPSFATDFLIVMVPKPQKDPH